MIQLDLNNPEFQANLLALAKPDAWAVLKTLRLLQAMHWEQLQSSKGLRWELIQSRQGPAGERLYSLRISRSCRAVAWRDGPWLRLLSLHPDHDSAYSWGAAAQREAPPAAQAAGQKAPGVGVAESCVGCVGD